MSNEYGKSNAMKITHHSLLITYHSSRFTFYVSLFNLNCCPGNSKFTSASHGHNNPIIHPSFAAKAKGNTDSRDETNNKVIVLTLQFMIHDSPLGLKGSETEFF